MAAPSFTLTACSTADRPRSFFESRGIPYACFHWQADGVDHLDDLYQSISPAEFFSKISAGMCPTTSQVGVGEYLELWEPILAGGADVLHIALSSGISGSYNAATVAAEQARAAHPGRRVEVLDSLGASSGYGMLVGLVADLRDKGATLDEARGWVLAHRNLVHHWFFSTDLTSYRRGGRVSAPAAWVGGLLKLCPLLNVNADGKLIPREKIRTPRRAISEQVARMVEHARDLEGRTGADYDGPCLLSHSACRHYADEVVALVERSFPKLADGRIQVNDIGTVIGSHTGPGTVALFFLGDERTE